VRILNRQNITKNLTDAYITQEASSLPMLTATPLILVDFYNINLKQSGITEGFKTYDSNILHEESNIVFDKIEDVPVGGISELNLESMFDEDEQGFSVDFSSSGFTFPNTVKPVEGSFFVMKTRSGDGTKTLIFRLQDIESNYIRNMSITGFNFSLAHTTPEHYAMLERQTYGRFVCLASQMGPETSLVVEKSKYVTLEEKIDSYLFLTEEYKAEFLSEHGVFLYRLENIMEGDPIYFYDRVFNKFLAANGIVFFDPIVSFARKQYGKANRTCIMEFDYGISDDTINKNILTGLINQKFPKDVQLYPIAKRMAAPLAKYQKQALVYADTYSTDTSQREFDFIDYMGKATKMPIYMDIFDSDFIDKIKTNTKYEDPIDGEPVDPDAPVENDDEYINKGLRNVIIELFNTTDISTIDYDGIDISFNKSEDTFYLIPVLMWFLQQYLTQCLER
jgi:hypothetical protein